MGRTKEEGRKHDGGSKKGKKIRSGRMEGGGGKIKNGIGRTKEEGRK